MDPVIPTIDFGPIVAGTSQNYQHTVSEIDDALRTIGFFYLVNHGIDQKEIDACFEWSQYFFNLPENEKLRCIQPRGVYDQGYVPINTEKVRDQLSAKECFDFCDPRIETRGPWPEDRDLKGLRDTAADFYQSCAELVHKLLDLLSIALNLDPEHSLGRYHKNSQFQPSLIRYPAVPAHQLLSGQIARGPAHSDFGTITLLFQQDVGGLQVADMSSTDKVTSAAVNRTAKFIDVEPKTGSILVNVGYLLMRWSDRRWKNTVHRVVEPPQSRKKKQAEGSHDVEEMVPERYSIAFFIYPEPETNIEPFPICRTEDTKYSEPLNVGDYLRKKRGDMYS